MRGHPREGLGTHAARAEIGPRSRRGAAGAHPREGLGTHGHVGVRTELTDRVRPQLQVPQRLRIEGGRIGGS